MTCSAQTTREQAEAIWKAAEAAEAERAELMPTEQDAIRAMWSAYQRLRELGWSEAIYCPKDGTVFDAIETGSTGIFRTHYSGEWPNGHWWAEDGGDLWPSRPCLYRPTSHSEGTPIPQGRQVSSSKGESQALASRDEPRP